MLIAVVLVTVGADFAQACRSHAADLFPKVQEMAALWKRSGHPLAGRVWQPAAKSDPGCNHDPLLDVVFDALDAIAAGGIVLLGEVHDNRDHHRFRAEILGGHTWLVTNAEGDPRIPTPGLVLEHIRADQQAGLDGFATFNARARRLGTANDLFRFVDWDKSGWPDKALFAPLITAAIRARLPILAGDPARETVRRVAMEGQDVLPAGEQSRLKLDVPLDAALQDDLLSELEDGHCGLMPRAALGTMAVAQRYRDAHLADRLVAAHGANGAAVLLAGNGHVRADRGVPWYLRRAVPGIKTTSVLLMEVEDAKTDAEAYGLRDGSGLPIADAIVFTPRQTRPDPCEAMRARMGVGKGRR